MVVTFRRAVFVSLAMGVACSAYESVGPHGGQPPTVSTPDGSSETVVDARVEPLVPEILANDEADPRHLVVVGDHVYWTVEATGSGAIRSRALDGGAPVTIVPNQGDPHDIVEVDGLLYWTNWYDGNAIMESMLDGGAVHPVLTQPTGGNARLKVNASRLSWAMNPFGATGPHRIASVQRDGSAFRSYDVSDAGFDYGGPVVTDDAIYWTRRTNPGQVMKAALDRGDVSVVVDEQSAPDLLVADETFLYWLVRGPETAVVRAPLAGGAPAVLATRIPSLVDLVVDAATIYAAGEDGKIYAISKGGGEPVPVVDAAGVMRLFVDDAFIYWTFRRPDAPGGLARVAKARASP